MSNKSINIILSLFAVLAVTVTVAITVYKNKDSLPVNQEETEIVTVADGFYLENDSWVLYQNGKISNDTGVFEGKVNGKDGFWMAVDGKIDFSLSSLDYVSNGNWQYVKNGEVIEKDNSSVSSLFGETLNSLSGKKDVEPFGGFSLSEEDKTLLETEIKKNNQKGCKTGFVVMNLNSLNGFSYNADEKIYSASTIKGPYVVSLVKNDNSLLQKERNRIEAILMRSSNVDYESLRDNYGDDCFISFSAETGNDLVVDTTHNYQFLTPRKLAHLWSNSYVFLQSSRTGKDLGDIFEKPEVSPINKIFGDENITQTKAGWLTINSTRVTNDAGVVYTENGDYLIVIMTTAPCDFTVLENLAGAIEKVIK